MDIIKSYLETLEGKVDSEKINEIKSYLSTLSNDEVLQYIEETKHAETYNSNYIKSQKELEKEWRASSKTTSYNSILVNITNATRETFTLTDSSWDIDETSPDERIIPPASYGFFLLRSEPPKRTSNANSQFRSSEVKHSFTYRSGEYAFEFSTLLKLHIPYDPFSFSVKYAPTRQHTIRSIGSKKLICLTDLERQQSEAPYNYAININIRN
ncbi:hypothetical protein [Pseudomonas sp. NMS19W]|uniref:hypothetical protein n=1 Tax=Pseudomonas sp. NMS19W TaxID=3079768 RepID=UPI003F658C5E